MRSITPSPLRLRVLCQQIVHGCLVRRPMTGMLTVSLAQSALKCTHAEIQISSQIPALSLIALVKQTLPGMRSQMLLEQTPVSSVTRQSRALLAEIW